MVEQFRARGHTVYVLTGDTRLPGVSDGTDDAHDTGTSDIHRDLYMWFRDLGRTEPTIPRPSIRERLRYERQNQRVMRSALAAFQPDVVSVWEMGALSLSTLTMVEQSGIPIVLTLHDYWPQYALHWDPWMRLFDRWRPSRWLGKPLGLITALPELSRSRANVISRNLAEKLATEGRWQFPDAPVIHFGIDPEIFPVVPPPVREWTWSVLYVGRLDVVKGVTTLARAMGGLPPEATLEVLGQGDPTIPAMVKEIVGETHSGDAVRFSSCPRSELAGRYREADVLVFPSEWDEPFGLVPLEAMACGIPVVATGTGGSAEYLRDGENCLLFPAGDPDGLAAAIRRLAEDPGLRQKLIAEGSQVAEARSLPRVADEIEALHTAAARGPSGGI